MSSYVKTQFPLLCVLACIASLFAVSLEKIDAVVWGDVLEVNLGLYPGSILANSNKVEI